MNFTSVEKKIEDFIAQSVRAAGAKGAVIGMSGGLDSAIVATLCVRALGHERVIGVMMPSHTNTHHDIEDAKDIATSLRIPFKIIPVTHIMDAFKTHLDHHDEVALGNLAARIRMCVLYYYANHLNYLVVGTGNKSELSIGYFTKYGDGGCDILPIGDLYKTQVKELARHLHIPHAIIERTPTAGLWPGQTDEGEIGMSYEELDKVLSGKAKNNRIKEMVEFTEHKRRPPEICRI